ncbi:MAG: DUF971 domain-containing protein [Betaproteobacteria bacterium]|nr:DUF971 domain-containing protein [Betaproteobacteria bacterium]
MAGLNENTPIPVEIKLHQVSRVMEITFDDGLKAELSFEFLRVYSPSAEVRGHGPGQETLQTGKREVEISTLEAIGHYAVRPSFSDGHDSGIYSWDYLYGLARDHEALWVQYLERLEKAGASRDSPFGGLRPTPARSCGHG